MTIGSIIAWGSNTIPDNWLLCDGSAVSRTTYADLFAVIGTNFGTGDGSTTFNLPDLRGRVGVGKSTDTEFDTLGENGGEKTQELRALIGAVNNSTNAIGYDAAPAVPGAAYDYAIYGTQVSEIAGINHSTPVTTAAGTAPSTLQPYIVTNYIIKALAEDKVKISELESASSIDGTEVLPIVQSGTTKKITTDDLLSDVYDTIEEVYSTNETLTNKIWTDGKPIYRLCLNGTCVYNDTIDINLSSYNIDRITFCTGWAQSFYNNEWHIPCYRTDNYQNDINYVNNSKLLRIAFGSYYDDTKKYNVILEYTKTTDTPVSL